MNNRFSPLYSLVNGNLDSDNFDSGVYSLEGISGNSIYNVGGKIGIGTATPLSRLSLADNISTGNIDSFDEYQILLFSVAGTPEQSYGLGIEANTMWFNSYQKYKFIRQGLYYDMIINDGRVGINFDVSDVYPSATLDINGNLYVRGGLPLAASWPALPQGTHMTWNGMEAGGKTEFLNQGGLGGGGFTFWNSNNGYTLPTKIFEINGNGTIWALGTYTGSDEVLKKNIKILDSPLEKLQNIRGVNYNWREQGGTPFSDDLQIGFIAQEVEAEYPELVMTNSDGIKAVAYDKFTAILLEAVKQQQAQIELLEGRLEALEGGLE
ncbi:MAG: tail fiber domain-containing protein [Spirochaetales bacterium]|nr:tail fiber domain-containing protein [Spirochaetales bacterium]